MMIRLIMTRMKTIYTITVLMVAIAGAGISAITVASITEVVQPAQAFIDQEGTLTTEPKAPMAVSQDGNNVYIVWWTNKSENWEVMFRASHDGGQTFGDKINLSNSTDAESKNANIVAAGNNMVLVSWWETNPVTGSSESVLRVSNDSGKTFGAMIMLGMNGSLSTAGNTTTAPTEGVGGEGGAEQQCHLEVTTNKQTFTIGEPVTINITNDGDQAIDFPNSVLGLNLKNRVTDEAYPLFSAQVITTLQTGESRTLEFTYEELVSEIGTGSIDASISGEGCSASTVFALG
jgi:hypothetical protein